MLLTKIFSVPLPRVWIAKLMSGGLAMTVSFLLNRGWVFGSREAQATGQVARFLITTISASWGIQLGLTQFFSSVWPAPGVEAFVVLSQLGLPAVAPGVVTEPAAIKTAAFGLGTGRGCSPSPILDPSGAGCLPPSASGAGALRRRRPACRVRRKPRWTLR